MQAGRDPNKRDDTAGRVAISSIGDKSLCAYGTLQEPEVLVSVEDYYGGDGVEGLGGELDVQALSGGGDF